MNPDIVLRDRVNATTALPLVSHKLSRLNAFGLGISVDLHLVTISSLALTLDLILIQLVLTFALNVHAAVLGELVIVDDNLTLSLGAFDTVHGVILTRAGSTICLALGKFLLLLTQLLSAVLLLVSGGKIGLGLLRRELGGSGSLRIPGSTRLVRLLPLY